MAEEIQFSSQLRIDNIFVISLSQGYRNYFHIYIMATLNQKFKEVFSLCSVVCGLVQRNFSTMYLRCPSRIHISTTLCIVPLEITGLVNQCFCHCNRPRKTVLAMTAKNTVTSKNNFMLCIHKESSTVKQNII